MGKKKVSAKTLRERAEQTLLEKDMARLGKLSEADTLALVHELRVHQIELELQNEELNHAHLLAQRTADRYTELYDFSPTGYFTISPDGLIEDLNISGANLFGEGRAAIQGKYFAIFLTDHSKEIFRYFIEDISRSKSKQICEVEVSYRKNKKTVYLAGVLDETAEKYFVSAADISELKTTQQKLVTALEKAKESAKLKASFLQNLRHEIRTPINAIVGFSDLLSKSSISESEKKSYYPIIVKSAHQLLSIVEDIISISLLETNQERVNTSEVNLNNLLIDLFSVFQPQAKVKQVSLKLRAAPQSDIQLLISTDQSKLTQIISNLLTNALKFTHEGEIEFGYQLADSILIFFVTDTGIGIEPSMHEKIFERFRQANNDIERKYGGTGLGLSISKGLVELLGGKIWVESIPNKGSSFYFSIPALVIEGNKTLQPQKIIGSPVILIAEDDELSFRFLSIAISQGLACEIHHARNGAEAIEMIKTKPEINFILMDINMPILSGVEAASKIKQLRPEVFIMAQTGYNLNTEKEKYVNLFDDYIAKPIDEKVLISQIKKMFGHQ